MQPISISCARGAKGLSPVKTRKTPPLPQKQGDAHEAAHLAKLKASGRHVIEIDRGDLAADAEETRAALATGAEVVFQGAFLAGNWGGWSDFLKRVERPSELGPFSYEVADTKLKRRPHPKLVLQLVLYSDLLTEIQDVVPEFAHVELGTGERARGRRCGLRTMPITRGPRAHDLRRLWLSASGDTASALLRLRSLSMGGSLQQCLGRRGQLVQYGEHRQGAGQETGGRRDLDDGGASHEPAGETPKGGLTVFLDGAHIRCRPEYQQRHLDLVVGKIQSRNMCRRFGLVANATASPSSRMREELSGFGWKPGRLLTVISDDEPALPNLIRSAMGGDGQVKHILDWWHISMRVRHVEAAVQGLVQTKGFVGNPVLFHRPAKSLRWWLWHGRARVAETFLKGLMQDCARFAEEPSAVRAAAARVRARCETLYTYLANNMESFVDYGRRYRKGLPISSSRAEGSVDDITNARMGKRRRMRWSPKGAHRVAVTRAAVLEGRLNVANRKRAA